MSSYILWGSFFGRSWKYIVVGLVLIAAVGNIVFLYTDNEKISSLVALLFALILLSLMVIKGYQAEYEQLEDRKRNEARMKEHAELLQVDENLCMSCLKPFGDSNECQYCGYTRKLI